MGPFDCIMPCFSCDRKDAKLEDCILCKARICISCWKLHLEYDHKKDQKRINYKEDEEND